MNRPETLSHTDHAKDLGLLGRTINPEVNLANANMNVTYHSANIRFSITEKALAAQPS